MPKKMVKPKFNSYAIISRAIEEGIPGGVYKYYKYRDDEEEPKEMEAMVDIVLHYIMLELCEVVNFDAMD